MAFIGNSQYISVAKIVLHSLCCFRAWKS